VRRCGQAALIGQSSRRRIACLTFAGSEPAIEEGTDAPPEGAAEAAAAAPEAAVEDPEAHEGVNDGMDWEDGATDDN